VENCQRLYAAAEKNWVFYSPYLSCRNFLASNVPAPNFVLSTMSFVFSQRLVAFGSPSNLFTSPFTIS